MVMRRYTYLVVARLLDLDAPLHLELSAEPVSDGDHLEGPEELDVLAVAGYGHQPVVLLLVQHVLSMGWEE
jgi:hypothetical protein